MQGVQVQSLVRERSYHQSQAKAKNKFHFTNTQTCSSPCWKSSFFLELSTVIYFLYLTVWIHRGPLSLKAKMEFFIDSSRSVSQHGDQKISAFLTRDPKRRGSKEGEQLRGVMEQRGWEISAGKKLSSLDMQLAHTHLQWFPAFCQKYFIIPYDGNCAFIYSL